MKILALLSSLTALLSAPLSTFAQLYSIEVIGPIQKSYTYASALNNHGQVLGSFGGQIDELYLSQNGVPSFPGNLGGLFPKRTGSTTLAISSGNTSTLAIITPTSAATAW